MSRKSKFLLSCALLALAACAPAGETPAPGAAAPVAPAETAAPVAAAPPPPPAAARWQADAPLRAGMARVRAATDALEQGGQGRAQVLALADEIESAVKSMIAQCKLEPAADAALHPLLARLLVASQALRDAPEAPAPLAELRAILAGYEQLFEESPL